MIQRLLFRAIYFTAYAKTKSLLNNSGLVKRDSSYVHMLSGLSAGNVLHYTYQASSQKEFVLWF